mgnify:CR=1 FL=1
MKRINSVSRLKLLEFLNRVPLFKGLNPREREEVASMPKLVVLLERDEVFIKKGEYDSSFYILLNGEAEVTIQQKHVATVTPGHFIGEVGFICNEPRSASVRSISEVIALRITKEVFDKLPIKVREGIKNKIISGLVQRVVSQNEKIVDLEEKIAEYEPEQSNEEAEAEQEDNVEDLRTPHPIDVKETG